MHKIAILSHGYPTPESPYNYAFVHARAKLYKHFNKKVKAFFISSYFREYSFEGINTIKGNIKECENGIKEFEPDILCVHSPATRSMQYLTKHIPEEIRIPKIIWIHGYEALLTPKYYPIILEPRLFLKWFYTSSTSPFRLKRMRNIFQDCDKRGDFIVFVSKWMEKEAKWSTGYSVKNSVVIPNPVDTNLFTFMDRTKKWKKFNEKKAITVRSLSQTKYGIDVAIKAFSNTNSNCILHVYGRGRLANQYKRLANKLSSKCVIHEKYFPHNQLPEVYKQYEIFISPSRTESQGLAMCEFMATGAPIIATAIGGIPEFVRDQKEGILVKKNDFRGIAEAVDTLVEDESLYKEMSYNCRRRAEDMLSEEVVTKKEISLMEKLINKAK